MLIVRFLFGSGWWITWYLAFHAAVALFVVLTLFIFGSEVKPAGQPPDPASPGSMMVFMIMLTLAGLTLVDSILFVRVLAAPGLLKTALVVAATAVVAVAGYKLNADLALAQSRPALVANIAFAATTVLANLVLLWFAQTRPLASIVIAGGGSPPAG
jgi:hypothetical protein